VSQPTCVTCAYYWPNAKDPRKSAHEGGICRLSPPPQASVDKDLDWCSHHELVSVPKPRGKKS